MDLEDNTKKKIKRFVMIYGFFITVIFSLHLILSFTNGDFAKTISVFYIVDYPWIVTFELFFYIIRGSFAFFGGLFTHFWLLMLSLPLTMLAIAYDVLLTHIYQTSKYYAGNPYRDVVLTFRASPVLFAKLEKTWQCCSFTGPYDEVGGLNVLIQGCCRKGTDCPRGTGFQIGCLAMSYLMYYSGIITIILLLFDLLAFTTGLILTLEIKDEDDDESED